MDLINICRVSHNNNRIQIFLSKTWTFFKVDHSLDHKELMNKYKTIGISLCLLRNSGMKLAKGIIETTETHGD